MKGMARSALLLVALTAIAGAALSTVFQTAAERHALLVSGCLAVAVQLAAFGLIRLAGRRNALAAWGMGAIFRGTILVFYGLFLARMLRLPLTAALTSFAVFLFVSMLLESLMLSNES
jgi:hypothetical protein